MYSVSSSEDNVEFNICGRKPIIYPWHLAGCFNSPQGQQQKLHLLLMAISELGNGAPQCLMCSQPKACDSGASNSLYDNG